ncbi:unnamed protein product [Periconia digitata]|uniref:C2H2-type domain-containing protein n=1 Tax=Periconia digitata TaxID=1303443 RepID=A0A9W4XXD7_9PLEO|nr:unnamed protein product [Periconia digitata]
MNTDESSASSLCARLYHVILEAFRNAISCAQKKPQLLSKLTSSGQRFKLWAAGLRIENGDLDAQLDEDADMKDSVLLLLGLILYDLFKTYQYIRPKNPAPHSGSAIDVHGSSDSLTARSLQDFAILNEPVLENSEKSFNLSRALDSDDAITTALDSGSADESHTEDHAQWIALLTYLCPNLQGFVTDADLEETNSSEPLDTDSEELVNELLDDIADTVQQLYDLGPSLAWEVMTRPKPENESETERPKPMNVEKGSMEEEGVIHYLHMTQDKFSHISNRLARRLAEANWVRFQRLEAARKAAEAERIRLVDRKIRDESHADSGYYTGSKSGTQHGQDDTAQFQTEFNNLETVGTEYGSVYTSMHRFSAQDRLRFPAPPIQQSEFDHKKVECTVCGSAVGPFRNKQEWRIHVVRDLAPYVCPVLNCESEQIIFDSQHSFVTHIKRYHNPSTSWRCRFPQCDDMLFSESHLFQTHIQSVHSISEGEDTEHLCDTWLENIGNLPRAISCPICNDALNVSLMQYIKHLGRHMIEVALLSIPNHTLDEDASSEESTASESNYDPLALENASTGEVNPASSAKSPVPAHDESTLRDKPNIERLIHSTPPPTKQQQKKKRVVGFQTDPVTSVTRPVSSQESWTIYDFEVHAQKCAYCRDPYEVHRNHEQLCETGHRLAQEVCAVLYNRTDGNTYSTTETENKLVCVEIPADYVQTRGLLKAVERSLRHRSRQPFVSMDRGYYVASRAGEKDRPSRSVKVETSSKKKRPPSGEIVEWPELDTPSSKKAGKMHVGSSKRGSLYEQDQASGREGKKYNVEIREPSRRDLREHRASGYYR